jgi:hypothetical protein
MGGAISDDVETGDVNGMKEVRPFTIDAGFTTFLGTSTEK